MSWILEYFAVYLLCIYVRLVMSSFLLFCCIYFDLGVSHAVQIDWKVPSTKCPHQKVASTNCRKSGVRILYRIFFPEREYRRITLLGTRRAMLRSIILFSLNIVTILAQLWVAGERPTIEWSCLPRKIVREKRLSFRDHGDWLYLVVLYVVACCLLYTSDAADE